MMELKEHMNAIKEANKRVKNQVKTDTETQLIGLLELTTTIIEQYQENIIELEAEIQRLHHLIKVNDIKETIGYSIH